MLSSAYHISTHSQLRSPYNSQGRPPRVTVVLLIEGLFACSIERTLTFIEQSDIMVSCRRKARYYSNKQLLIIKKIQELCKVCWFRAVVWFLSRDSLGKCLIKVKKKKENKCSRNILCYCYKSNVD